jgi:hypothetical protein
MSQNWSGSAVKRVVFRIISVVLGILLGATLIEVSAIGWLYLQEYRYEPASKLFERTQNAYVRGVTRTANCRYIDTLFPHPYVAFVHHGNPPCGIPNVNNAGLFNDDLPVVKRTDRFSILLVGGSLAAQLAQNQPWPPRFLEEELNNRYISPNGKPFLVLGGGDGAWKQPQPFILFSLYASALDGVVSLEGGNERFWFVPGTESRLEKPGSNFLAVNPFAADENFGDAAIGYLMGRVAGALAEAPILGQSHAVYLIVRGIEAAAKGHGNLKSSKKTTLDSLFAMPEEIRKDPDKLFAVQLGLYQKYMKMTEAIARNQGVKSAYFLAPVPAFGKELSEEEKRVVGDLSYGPLYRRMVDGMMTLREEGVPVFDLGEVFKDVHERVYADESGHMQRTKDHDSLGNRIMAARMAETIAATWGLQPRK